MLDMDLGRYTVLHGLAARDPLCRELEEPLLQLYGYLPLQKDQRSLLADVKDWQRRFAHKWGFREVEVSTDPRLMQDAKSDILLDVHRWRYMALVETYGGEIGQEVLRELKALSGGISHDEECEILEAVVRELLKIDEVEIDEHWLTDTMCTFEEQAWRQ